MFFFEFRRLPYAQHRTPWLGKAVKPPVPSGRFAFPVARFPVGMVRMVPADPLSGLAILDNSITAG